MDCLNNSTMKTHIYILFFISAFSFAQEKYLTKTGLISFEASVPSFEEVAAKNNSVTAIINTENGEIAVLTLIKGFRFKNALMEEHFNENYAESDKYPKAIFEGNIENYSNEKDEGIFKVIGNLTFHGVTKTVKEIPVRVIKEEDKIIISGIFKLMASDFKIDIPKIVRNKIAEDVDVNFRFELLKK